MIKKIAMNRTIRTVVALTLVGVLTFSNIGDLGVNNVYASATENDSETPNDGSPEINSENPGDGEEHTHSFDGASVVTSEGNTHVLKCAAADCDQTDGYQKTEDCTDADENGFCDVCGGAMSSDEGTGDGAGAPVNEEGESGGDMTKCAGGTSEEASDHTATIIWDVKSDEVGVHTGVCSECDTIVKKACDNEEGVCPVCGFGDEENPSFWEKLLGLFAPLDNHEHVFDEDGKCTVEGCDATFENSHEHKYGIDTNHTCTVTYVKDSVKDADGNVIEEGYTLVCTAKFAAHTHNAASQSWVSDGQGKHYKQCSVHWGTPGTNHYGKCESKDAEAYIVEDCNYELKSGGKLICSACHFDQSEKESLSIRGVIKWDDTDVDGKDWHGLIRPRISMTNIIRLEATNKEQVIDAKNVADFSDCTTLVLKYDKSATAEKNYCSISELESGDQWQYLITNVPRYKYYRITVRKEGTEYYEEVKIETTETKDSQIQGSGIVVEPDDVSVKPIMGKFKISKEMLGAENTTSFGMNVSFSSDRTSSFDYKTAGGTVSLSAGNEIIVEAPEKVHFTVSEKAESIKGYVARYKDNRGVVASKDTLDDSLKPAVVYNIPLDQTVSVEKLWNDNNDSSARMGKGNTAEAQNAWKAFLDVLYVLEPAANPLVQPDFDANKWTGSSYKKLVKTEGEAVKIDTASDWEELTSEAARLLGFSENIGYDVTSKSFNNWTATLTQGNDATYKKLFPSFYISEDGKETYRVYYQIKEKPIVVNDELMYTASVKKEDSSKYVITNTKITEFKGKIAWEDKAITANKVTDLMRPSSVTVDLYRTSPGEAVSNTPYRTRTITKNGDTLVVTDEDGEVVNDVKIITSDGGNTWNLAFKELDMYDAEGFSYTYSLKERDVQPIHLQGEDINAGYKISYNNGTGPYAQYTDAIFYEPNHDENFIFNTLSDSTTFSATKKWVDQGGDTTKRVDALLALYRYPSTGSSEQASPAVVVTPSGTKVLTQALKKDAEANGSYTFDFSAQLGENLLPKFDENGDLYIYFVKEIYDESQADTTKYKKSYENIDKVKAYEPKMDTLGAGNGGTIINSNLTKDPFTLQMDWLTQAYQNSPAKATVYLQVQKKGELGWENVDAYDAKGNIIESTNNSGVTTNTIKLEGFNSSLLSQTKTIYLDKVDDKHQEIEYRLVEVRVEITDGGVIECGSTTSESVEAPVFKIDDHRYAFQPFTYLVDPGTKAITKTTSMVKHADEDTIATLYCSNALSDTIKYQAVKRWTPKPKYPDEATEPSITLKVTQRSHDNKKDTGVTSEIQLTKNTAGVTSSESAGNETWTYTFENAGQNDGAALQKYDELGYQYVYRLSETACNATTSEGSTYHHYVTINEAYKSTVTNYTEGSDYRYLRVEIDWEDDGDSQNREVSYVQMEYVIGEKVYTLDEVKAALSQVKDSQGNYEVNLDGHIYKIPETQISPIKNAPAKGIYEINANMGWVRDISVPATIYEDEAEVQFKYQFHEISLGASSEGTHYHKVDQYTSATDYSSIANGNLLKDLDAYYGTGADKSINMAVTENQVYSIAANQPDATSYGSTWIFTNRRIGLVDYTVYKIWEDGNGRSVLADFVEGKGAFDISGATYDNTYVARPDITITLHKVGYSNTTTFDKNNQMVTIKSENNGDDKLLLKAYQKGTVTPVNTDDYALSIVDKNTWKYTFKNMPKYAEDGELLEYIVTESTAPINGTSQASYDTTMKESAETDYTENPISTGDESRYFVKNLRTGTSNYTMYVHWLDGQSTERPDVYVQMYYQIGDKIYKYGADKDKDIANNVYIGDELEFVWKDAASSQYDRYCYIYGLNSFDHEGNEIKYFTSASLSTMGDYQDYYYETLVDASNHNTDELNKHKVTVGEKDVLLAPDQGCVVFRLESQLEVNGIKNWQNLQTGTRITDLDPMCAPIIMLMRTKTVKDNGISKEVIVPFKNDTGEVIGNFIYNTLSDGLTKYRFESGMTLEALSGVDDRFSKPVDIDEDGIPDESISYNQVVGKLGSLDKYDEDGQQYTYKAIEVMRSGSMFRVYKFEDNSFTLTNTFETSSARNTRSVYVSKNWDFTNLSSVGYDVNKMNTQKLYPILTYNLYRVEMGKESVHSDWTSNPDFLIQTKTVNLNNGTVTTTIDGISTTVPIVTTTQAGETKAIEDGGTLTFTNDAKALAELAFTNLRIWSENGLQYKYAVKEVAVNGYDTYQASSIQNPGTAEVTESTYKKENVCVLIENEFANSISATDIANAKVTAKFANQYQPGDSVELVGQKFWVDQASTELRPDTLNLQISRRAKTGEATYTDVTSLVEYKWMNSPVENPEQWETNYNQSKDISWKDQTYGSQSKASHYWVYRVKNNGASENNALSKWAPNGTEFIYDIKEILDETTAKYYTNTASGCKAETFTVNGCGDVDDSTNHVRTKIVKYNLVNKLNVNYTVQKTWEDGSNRYQLRPSGLVVVLQRRTVKGTGDSAKRGAWEYISPYALSNGAEIPAYNAITDEEKKSAQICTIPQPTNTAPYSDSSSSVVAVRLPKTATSTYTFANLPAAKVVETPGDPESTRELIPYEYRAIEYAIIGVDGNLRTAKYGDNSSLIPFDRAENTPYVNGTVGAYNITEEFAANKLTIKNALISAKLKVTKKWDDNHNQYETRPTNAQGTPFISFYLKYAFKQSGETPTDEEYGYLTTDGLPWNNKSDATDNRLKNTMTFAGDEYTYTFTNLPNVDADGNRYWYTVEEVINADLDSYTNPNNHEGRIEVTPIPEDGTFIYAAVIKNKLKILEKEEEDPVSGTVTAKKIWIGEEADAEANFGQYPAVQFTLIRYIKKKDTSVYVLDNYLTDKTITLDGEIDPEGPAMRESDQWTATWTGLPATDNMGQPYKYFVKEESAPAPYQYMGLSGKLVETKTVDSVDKVITSSTIATESTDGTEWKPEAETDSVNLLSDKVWNYEFKFYNLRQTSLEVTKVWNDDDNKFYTRPDELKVTLQRKIEGAEDSTFQNVTQTTEGGGAEVVKATMTQANAVLDDNKQPTNVWKYKFNNLPLYAYGLDGIPDGKRFEYRAVELLSDTKLGDLTLNLADAYTITNGITEGEHSENAGKTNTDSVASVRTYDETFSTEDKKNDLFRTYAQTITNTLKRDSKLKVSVIWDDVNNQDGIRPASVTAQLYAQIGSNEARAINSRKDLDPSYDGTDTTLYKRTISYTGSNPVKNRWPKETYIDLPLYSMKSGTPVLIKYSFKEDAIAYAGATTGYKALYGVVTSDGSTDTTVYYEDFDKAYAELQMLELGASEDAIKEIRIKNVHVPDKVNKTVTKKWENLTGVPASLLEDAQPNSIDVYLQKRYVKKNVADASVKYLKTNGSGTVTDADFGAKDDAYKTYVVNAATNEATAPGTDVISYVEDTWSSVNVTLTGTAGTSNWSKTWYKQPVNYNPTGTEEDPGISYGIEYSVVEKDWNATGTTSGVDITEDDAEAKVVGAFTSKVSAESSNAFNVTNTLQKTKLVVTKVWNDEDDKYATRPTSLSFVLQRRVESGAAGSAAFVNVEDASGNDVKLTLTEANKDSVDTNKWSGTFDNLPIKDEHGYIISYRAVEVTKLAAESSETLTLLDAYTCTNGIADDTQDINVTVTYKAADADSEKTTGTINKTAYVATDKEVESYAQEITNTLRKEGAIKVAKVWDDDNNRDGLRPDTVTMNLYRIPVTAGDTTAVAVTDSSSNQLKRDLFGTSAWKSSFGVNDADKLPIYTAKNNKIELIPYQIQETGVSNYTTTYRVDGADSYVADYGTVNAVKPASASDSSNVKEVSVKNTYTPAHTARQIEKIWNNNSADSKLASDVRPDSITVYLTATYKVYGTDTEGHQTSSDKEVFVNGNGAIITAAGTGQPIEVPANATADQVPDAAKVTLSAASKNEAGNWIYTWTSDSMYVNTNESYVNGDANGTGYVKGSADAIVYKAYELPMNGYSHAIVSVTEDSKETGYKLTNTMRTTYLDVTKVWVDENNGYKTRPNSIQVYLQQKTSADSTYVNAKLADGKDYVIPLSKNSENKAGKNGSTVDAAGNTWVGCFVNMPLYDKSQNLIEYRAVEIVDFEDGSNLTTVYTPSNALLTENNNAGPASTVVPDTADAGVTMQHYTQTITNTLKYGNIKVEKVWDDNSDEDKLRPTALKITLKRDDGWATKKDAADADDNQTITLQDPATAPDITNVWEGSFLSLPVGTAAGNQAKLFKYTMLEGVDAANDSTHELVDYDETQKIKDGDSVVEVGDGVELVAVADATDTSAAKIYSITNTLSVVEISVKKIWDDQDDLFQSRPDTIEMTLQRKTENTDSVWTDLQTDVLKKEKNWEPIVFKDLHKFNTAGEQYLYQVIETPVKGYTTGDPEVLHDEEKGKDLQTVTFTNELELVSVSGKVTFEGEDGFSVNQLTALRGETPIHSSNPDLNTELILYRVNEDNSLTEYKNYPDGNDTAARIVPTYEQGQPVAVNNTWTYKFDKLPKYDKEGNQIVYAVMEDYSKRYMQTTPDASKDGVQRGQVDSDGNVTDADFVNYLETFTVKGSKTWNDASNKFNTRPEKLGIVIGYPTAATVADELKSGVITWEKVDADGNPLDVWNYTITGLLRKDSFGNDIAYSFRECNDGETIVDPLTDFDIKNYENVTINGNDNIKTDTTYKTKYTGIAASNEATTAAATAAGKEQCTGITYSTDANGMAVVEKIDFKNSVKADAILGIHNVTTVEPEVDSDKKVIAGGKVGVVEGTQTADQPVQDVEAMDSTTVTSKTEFAVSWVADENWRYKNSFTVTYYDATTAGANEQSIEITDFMNEDGSLKDIADSVYDPLREVFKMDDGTGGYKDDLAITKDATTGEIKLILGTKPAEMQPATFVKVEFVPTIAIENKTAGYAGGVVQVEDGVAGKNADGLLDVDGKPSYIGRTVKAKADSGYEIDMSYLTIAPLRKAHADSDDGTLTGKIDGLFTMKAYAADVPNMKKITLNGNTFLVSVPATIAGTDMDIDVTGTVSMVRDGSHVTGITITLDKDTVPLEFGVRFKEIPKSSSGGGDDSNSNGSKKPALKPEDEFDKNQNGPAKTGDPMPIGAMTTLGSILVALGAALRIFGRRKRKNSIGE